MENSPDRPPDRSPGSLRQLAGLCLRLGVIAFGGPAAHIALFREEVVRRLKWLSEEEFLDLLGAVNLIPGPNSTELVIHIGLRRAGWRGLVVAGSCFILPAALISGLLAWVYVRFGRLPELEGLLYGAKPVIMVVILRALWGLGRTALKTPDLAVLAAIVAGLNLLGVNELVLLAAAGLFYVAARTWGRERPHPAIWPLLPLTASAPAAAAVVGLGPLFLFFLKVGAVLFGSGYVLLAFLRADLVERWHWITEAQLLDAVTVGQVTPGPLLSTATFIGFLVAGGAGAVVATVGIFLPSFVYVAMSGPLIPRLRTSLWAGPVLDGVNAAALALMAVVSFQLGHAAFVDLPTVLIGAPAPFLSSRRGMSPTGLIAVGAAVGWLARTLG